MRLLPRSLFGRLLALAALSTLAALGVAGIGIGHVLERVVMRGLDDRLDAQIAVLAGALRRDGTLDPARTVALPGFGEPGSGWTWRVDAAGRRWRSGPDAIALDGPPPPPPPFPRGPRPGEGRPGEGRGAGGRRLHARTFTVMRGSVPVTITATGPRRFVAAPLREAMVPLLLSLGLLGAALTAATLVQLRLGLRPLGLLRDALADVIAGRRRHVPVDVPIELAPLAGQLNALIDRNEAGLEHARRHVANLAHGLKTPLAALALKLAEEGRDPDGSLAATIAAMDRRIGHHLRRARAATPGGGPGAATPLAPAIDDLVAVLRRLHAGRGLIVAVDVPAGLSVAVDPQDLDEMTGNLLDNAWRHADGRVWITATRADATIRLAIEDDGAGLTQSERSEALMPGRRIDERAPGHGFGLPITQELAELNGGGLALSRGAGGGLRALLTLPAAA